MEGERIQADLGLQLGADLEVDVEAVAEAIADQEKRKTHGTYDLKLNTKYLAVNTRKDRDISCKKRGRGEWVLIGGDVGAAYLPPHFNQYQVERIMEGMMREWDTLMGDLNWCSGSKRRVLTKMIERMNWDDMGTTQQTHKQGNITGEL